MKRSDIAAAALLVLVVIVLGLRAIVGAREVLAQPSLLEDSAVRVTNPLAPSPAELELKSTPPPRRDPFRHPPVVRKQTIAPPRVVEDQWVAPVVAALLYDASAPLVQLRVGAATSGWLSPGGYFQGWTVLKIRPDSTVVEGQGKRLVLR